MENDEYYAAYIGEDGFVHVSEYPITFKAAVERGRRGGDVYSIRASKARRVAETISRKHEEPEEATRVGYFDHFHARPRTNSHFFFGFPKLA